MKFNLKIFLMAFLLLAFILPVFAGTTYDKAVSIKDPDGKLVYYGSWVVTDSVSGATYYTQGFYIGATNSSYAMARFIMAAGAGNEDVNVFVEYSYDATNWIAGTTDTGLDAVGTTAVIDTIGIRDLLLYKSALFMRFKFVNGGTIGSNIKTWTWSCSFIKPDGVIAKNFGHVFNTQ